MPHQNGLIIAAYDVEDRLLQWRDNTYQYTQAGDLASKTTPSGTTRYDYDSLGNLRRVQLSDGTLIDYLIDPENRRIGKKRNGVLQWGLLYEDSLRPIAELKPEGGVRSVFLYLESGNAPSALLRDGRLYRIITDHLGSVRLVIDTHTNTVVQQMDYDVWGRVTYDSLPGFQPFGFAGGVYDRDTGLTRFGARDYDAETGRWTAKDPILFAGGDTNLYGYVESDPVNFADPTGLWSVKVSFFLGKGGSATFGRSDGKWFVQGGAGVGIGAGIKFYPDGSFPEPSDGGQLCGSEGYIGFGGSFGASFGPLSAEIKGQTGGIVGESSDGKLQFKFTEGGGPDISLRGQAGWGLSLGGGATATVGIAW
ncbi:MAG: RHS repeat-associated core domain-containing protein [Rhodocyclaceae bacterium]